MNKNVFVSDLLEKRGSISGWFIIAEKETKAGDDPTKSRVCLKLQDRTGNINAVVWDAADVDADVGDVVGVKGTIGTYRQKPQFTVAAIRKANEADGPPDMAWFLAASKYDRDDMLRQLDGYVTDMDNRELSDLLAAILQNHSIRPKLRDAPASKMYHQAWLGGLLEHILAMIDIAIPLAIKYHCDHEILIAACILHDIGKLTEYEFGRGPIRTTRPGLLLGHIPMGCALLERFAAYSPEPISIDLIEHLEHIILSHHGSKEFGSPVEPATPEAVLFNYVDLIDSRMAAITAAFEAPKTDEEIGTYVPMLKSRFLRLSSQQYSPTGENPGEQSVEKTHGTDNNESSPIPIDSEYSAGAGSAQPPQQQQLPVSAQHI